MLLYEYGFGYETVSQWYLVENGIESFFRKLFEKFGTYNYKVYLNGSTNFRDKIAVTHEYKGNRKNNEKPKWYYDIKDYLIHCHRTVVMDNGLESDDGLAMNLTRNPNTICCSRDKDLRTVQGWHYCWPTSRTPEKPLEYIDSHGYLSLVQKGRTKSLLGGGNMFLYAQSIMGDSSDNIIGLKGMRDVAAYEKLKDCKTEVELYDACKEAYEAKGETVERLHENLSLLWMVRELDSEGNPVMWRAPDETQVQ